MQYVMYQYWYFQHCGCCHVFLLQTQWLRVTTATSLCMVTPMLHFAWYCLHSIIDRDQPNSREKMRDFTVDYLKCVKLHVQFTERVTNDAKLSIAK